MSVTLGREHEREKWTSRHIILAYGDDRHVDNETNLENKFSTI